ncbi:MAG TPA: translation initiation factor IF-1 [Planctomycetota bacterium]|nr:translation initiation factor IF-1 [Planctomycetota bacterium]
MSAAQVEAVVLETLPNARYRCRRGDGGEVTCHVGGRMRLKVVRVLPGETVVIEPSPLDPSKGRIVGKGRSLQS